MTGEPLSWDMQDRRVRGAVDAHIGRMTSSEWGKQHPAKRGEKYWQWRRRVKFRTDVSRVQGFYAFEAAGGKLSPRQRMIVDNARGMVEAWKAGMRGEVPEGFTIGTDRNVPNRLSGLFRGEGKPG